MLDAMCAVVSVRSLSLRDHAILLACGVNKGWGVECVPGCSACACAGAAPGRVASRKAAARPCAQGCGWLNENRSCGTGRVLLRATLAIRQARTQMHAARRDGAHTRGADAAAAVLRHAAARAMATFRRWNCMLSQESTFGGQWPRFPPIELKNPHLAASCVDRPARSI